MKRTQRQTETTSESTSQEWHSQVFSGLWLQAASENLGRRIDRAKNIQGQRALKFKTRGFHKALILEANCRPGFIVRLCGLAEKPGLIDSRGVVTFANPVETESFGLLLSQIDRWASSFEILYGQVGAVDVTPSISYSETTSMGCEVPASIDQEEISVDGDRRMDGPAPSEKEPAGNSDHMEINTVSDTD